MPSIRFRSLVLACAVAVGGVAVVGCTTTRPQDQASSTSARASIDAQVDAALSKLYDSARGSRELVASSKGVLVFPAVVGASMGIGAEYGRGALRVGGRTQAYYSTTAGSIGFQAGAQSKAVIYVFTTQAALDRFRNSKGWTAGADATVASAPTVQPLLLRNLFSASSVMKSRIIALDCAPAWKPIEPAVVL